MLDLGPGKIEAAGDARARHAQSSDGTELPGVSAQQQGSQNGGPNLGLRLRLLTLFAVAVGSARAQLHQAPLGEGVPQLAFSISEFLVRQHPSRVTARLDGT